MCSIVVQCASYYFISPSYVLAKQANIFSHLLTGVSSSKSSTSLDVIKKDRRAAPLTLPLNALTRPQATQRMCLLIIIFFFSFSSAQRTQRIFFFSLLLHASFIIIYVVLFLLWFDVRFFILILIFIFFILIYIPPIQPPLSPCPNLQKRRR